MYISKKNRGKLFSFSCIKASISVEITSFVENYLKREIVGVYLLRYKAPENSLYDGITWKER